MFSFRVVDEDVKDLALGVANISISLLGQCFINMLTVQYPTQKHLFFGENYVKLTSKLGQYRLSVYLYACLLDCISAYVCLSACRPICPPACVSAGLCAYAPACLPAIVLNCVTELSAYVPAPLIFGAAIDSVCNVWQEVCGGRRGACWSYDVTRFRVVYHALTAAFKSIAIPAFVALLWLHNRKRTDEQWEETSREKE